MSKDTRLLIARHGNTFGPNDLVRRVGITDLPLVESGLEQGTRLGHYLKEHHLIPDRIYTSELKRTKQTAQQIIEVLNIDIPIESNPIFNEIDYGQDENALEADILSRLGKKALSEWDSDATVPQGWNVDPKAIIQQWKLFSNTLVQDHCGQTVLVVTSNGIARFAPYLLKSFDDFTAKQPIKISTGSLCLFSKHQNQEFWDCQFWNKKP